MQRCCKYSRNSAMYRAVQMKKYVENIHVALVQNSPVIFVLPSNSIIIDCSFNLPNHKIAVT